MIGLCVGNIGFYIASVVPVPILITLKLLELNPQTAVIGALEDQFNNEKRWIAGGVLAIFSLLGIQLGVRIMTAINNVSIAIKFNVLAIIGIVTALICYIIIKDSPAEKNQERWTENKKKHHFIQV